MFKEFRDFVLRGNVLDLAVAVVIGAAFTAIVSSLVDNIIMPVIGLIGGSPDFSEITLGPLLIGNFINSVISFLLIALVVFFVFVRPMNMMMRRMSSPGAPSTKQCPECLAEIPAGARRCQYCTIVLDGSVPAPTALPAAMPAD